ncbi:hypothetical protein GYH30_009637 [Glycine max]|uniref:V-type proton ATPase subunit C n=1 Tax=Glycine max TaxID=3847 RepID=K7KJH7_SOYBN|nr:hypothetical protein GYH30_009637 [Glycine max]
MVTRYRVVSLPIQNSASTLWNKLQEQISEHSFDTLLYRNPRLPPFPQQQYRQVSHMIRRQIEELESVWHGDQWFDGGWSPRFSVLLWWMQEIIDGIHGQVAKNEDDLKVHVSEYNNICTDLNDLFAIHRKIGSLAMKH